MIDTRITVRYDRQARFQRLINRGARKEADLVVPGSAVHKKTRRADLIRRATGSDEEISW